MAKIEKTPLDVEIEAIETWPPNFLQGAIQNRELILSYQQERQRIFRLSQDDLSLRIYPPENKYEYEYNELLEHLDEILIQHRVVGYHCTRLTSREITDIKSNGLRLLSLELVHQRLSQCVTDGHMTRAHFEYLSDSEIMRESLSNNHGNRTGMIWFCPNRSTLQRASGVYRLFRSWGGEAVYFGHEDDPNITATLTSIGTPCIVKCAISFPLDAPYYPKFAARFLSQSIANEIEYAEPPAGFDLHTKRDVSASNVLDIIAFSDPQFEVLTRCSTWITKYRIRS